MKGTTMMPSESESHQDRFPILSGLVVAARRTELGLSRAQLGERIASSPGDARALAAKLERLEVSALTDRSAAAGFGPAERLRLIQELAIIDTGSSATISAASDVEWRLMVTVAQGSSKSKRSLERPPAFPGKPERHYADYSMSAAVVELIVRAGVVPTGRQLVSVPIISRSVVSKSANAEGAQAIVLIPVPGPDGAAAQAAAQHIHEMTSAFVATFDLILETDQGFVLVEHKTGNQPAPESGYEAACQAWAYSRAAREIAIGKTTLGAEPQSLDVSVAVGREFVNLRLPDLGPWLAFRATQSALGEDWAAAPTATWVDASLGARDAARRGYFDVHGLKAVASWTGSRGLTATAGFDEFLRIYSGIALENLRSNDLSKRLEAPLWLVDCDVLSLSERRMMVARAKDEDDRTPGLKDLALDSPEDWTGLTRVGWSTATAMLHLVSAAEDAGDGHDRASCKGIPIMDGRTLRAFGVASQPPRHRYRLWEYFAAGCEVLTADHDLSYPELDAALRWTAMKMKRREVANNQSGGN